MDYKKLNQRIIIVTPGAKTSDNIGGWTEAAASESTVWGGAVSLSMREMLLYGMPTGISSFKFIFRYETAKNVTQEYKLKYRSRTFNIVSVRQPEEVKDEIEIIANEQV